MASDGGNGIRPPLSTVSDHDHSGVVIISWSTFLILTLIVVIARLVTRLRVTRLKLDDAFIVSASALAVVQSICVQLAVDNGLGKHRASLDTATFERFCQYLYASQLLLVASVALSKVSVVLLIQSLQPERALMIACHTTLTLVVLWAVTSILLLAFQCQLPMPWLLEPDRCMSQLALYAGIGAFNILTDTMTIALPAALMAKVHVAARKKLIVVVLFGMRALVIATTLAQLATLRTSGLLPSEDAISSTSTTTKNNAIDNDLPWRAVGPTIWTQLLQSLAIVTACIPSLKRLVGDLGTGLTSGAISEHMEMSGSASANAHAMGMSSGSASAVARTKGFKAFVRESSYALSSSGFGTGTTTTTTTATTSSDSSGPPRTRRFKAFVRDSSASVVGGSFSSGGGYGSNHSNCHSGGNYSGRGNIDADAPKWTRVGRPPGTGCYTKVVSPREGERAREARSPLGSAGVSRSTSVQGLREAEITKTREFQVEVGSLASHQSSSA